jgi:hypothetical protein
VIVGRVTRRQGSYSVQLSLRGTLFDEAGPFDEEYDATEAARRMCDDVITCTPPRAPYRLGDRGAD